MKDIVNFLFEVGILSKTPRSGLFFTGSGDQSVAEHVLRVIFIGYTLASLERDVNMTKVLKMCLLHDISESRISDLNYVHQQYVQSDEKKAVKDLTQTLPFGDDMEEIIEEYEARQSKEAILAKDADNLEWIITLKEEFDKGNSRTKTYITSAIQRLKTDAAKSIAEEIIHTEFDEWWFRKKDDSWWINREKDSSKTSD